VQHLGNVLQPVVLWFGRLQWLFLGFVEFIDEDSNETRPRRRAVVRHTVVIVAWAGLRGKAIVQRQRIVSGRAPDTKFGRGAITY
jgi:hypothetical protein